MQPLGKNMQLLLRFSFCLNEFAFAFASVSLSACFSNLDRASAAKRSESATSAAKRNESAKPREARNLNQNCFNKS